MCSVLHCKQPQWPGDSLRKYEGGLKQQGECQVLGTPALPTFSHPIGLAYLHPLGHKQRPYPFSASSVKCRAATKREALGLCVGCGHLLLFTADCPGCGEGQTTPHPPPLPRHWPSTPLHRWARRLREVRALLRSHRVVSRYTASPGK